ncbi:MAG: sigma-70 family RNA polymerase sigma factor [Firmicutes bacterium]|nr:sigma-70 family RNA polymerase sigma factor [Bacillota bacterium]
MTKNTVDKLYRRHRVSIFRYFYKMGGNYHLAEELTQETFYQAAVSLDGFRGESTLSTWLFRIAFYVYTGHLRRNREVRSLDWDIPDTNMAGDPARAAENAESMRLAGNALQKLPLRYRAAIVLREIEGLTFEELGAVLDVSPSTARVILFRAKERFRSLFNQLTEGDSSD